MIRPTPILAALAALCAPPAAEAAFYRATGHTIACAARSDIQNVMDLALADDDTEYQATARALLHTGRCVIVAKGAALIIKRVDGEYVEIDVSADPRPLWAHATGIDWSAR